MQEGNILQDIPKLFFGGLIVGCLVMVIGLLIWVFGVVRAAWQNGHRNEGRYGNKRQKECEEAPEAETGEAKETRGKEEIVSLGTS